MTNFDSDKSKTPEPVEENLHYICPNCDGRMTDRSCKLLCRRCGYFMSCADYI